MIHKGPRRVRLLTRHTAPSVGRGPRHGSCPGTQPPCTQPRRHSAGRRSPCRAWTPACRSLGGPCAAMRASRREQRRCLADGRTPR
eukprot:scaffold7632_cov391-Pinguiococcus_pyrenoidosus.AAC.1